MNNLEIGVSRPHYINRNQQFEKRQCEKTSKIKNQKRTIPIKNILPPKPRHDHQEEINKVKELKEWLFGLLSGARDNWEEELASRRNWVMAMREQHRQKLMRILQYIQSLRKQAYEKYRHVCDRTREEGCTDCRQTANYFNDLVRNYLANDKPKGRNNTKENIKNKGEAEKEKENLADGKDSGRPSIDRANRNQSKRGSRLSHLTSSSQGRVNTTHHDFYLETDKAALKKPYSKFKHAGNERDSRNQSIDKEPESDVKLRLSSQRDAGVEYRFSQSKREDTIDGRYISRVRKSSQIPAGSTQEVNSRRNLQGTRGEDSFSKRDSKSSLRQSVLRPSGKNAFVDSQFVRSGQFKLIDAEQAMARGQSGPSGRYGRFGLPRSSNGQLLPDEILERSLKKRKSQGRNRNNRYIKKNSSENNEIDIEITSSSSDDKEDFMKREREGIQELIKEKEYFREDHYKKVSRYRRQRMIYDILKREILVNDGIEEAPEAEMEAEEKDIHYTEMSSNYDLSVSRELEKTTPAPKPKRKKYSLMERKESLISKLALLNQGNTIESIRGKIEQILHERGLMAQGKQEKMNGKNMVEKFISEVLKITDLKRLMKEKFIKQADWSPKMRQMHQFYTYLEYSMEAFHSKLNKTTQFGWKELTYEGKLAEAKLDGLVLDNQMRDWEGLDLTNLAQENHREIQCSMKYYGIDVKRLKNLNQISYQVAANKTLNPVFSSVGQRSMKNIQEITQSLFAPPTPTVA